MKKEATKEELRNQAEKRLKELLPEDTPPPEGENELRRLVHELQVHQMELEIQNDELLLAKEALEESNTRYADLYDFAPVGYFTLDRKGAILGVNLKGACLLGVERSRLSGQRFNAFVNLPDRQAFASFLDKIVSGGEAGDHETSICDSTGGILHLRIDAGPAANGVECRLAVTDISEMKAAEEERHRLESKLRHSQKMEAIGTLAGGIAHDFNNLLSIIIGYTTLTVDTLSPWSEERDNLANVLTASERAKDLVGQILAFGRKGEKKSVPLDVCLAVRETLRLLKTTIPASVTLVQEIDQQPLYALIGPTEMHQVVINLCTNAVHSLQAQAGKITVRLTQTEVGPEEASRISGIAPGSFVVLEVLDTGAGMDEETVSRIFEPYFTTKGLGSGTGLGLAVVSGIVAGNNGAIEVKSSPGEGTNFTLYLPKYDNSSSQSEQTETTALPRGNGTVLLIDDEPRLVRLGKLMLEKLGYTVNDQTDPEAAIALFETLPGAFDVIVTDQTMPGLMGTELIRRARLAKPGIPTVMCTGYSNLVDEKSAAKMGINVFVRKPYDINELGRAVALALGNRITPPVA